MTVDCIKGDSMQELVYKTKIRLYIISGIIYFFCFLLFIRLLYIQLIQGEIYSRRANENRTQIKAYAGSLWNQIIEDISKSRNIPAAQLNKIADDLDGNLASRALDSRLVDKLMYRDELIDTLKNLSGISSGKDLNLVSMSKYGKVPEIKSTYSVKNKIAVIYTSGNIVMGKGGNDNIGGNYYADVIRKARLDTTVKAIVLRVNSPGGNAIAADIIWRELVLAAEKKPLVISMGNYAASGGYYISAPGTKIYADPMTISGSIGVFGMIPNAEKLLEDKLGLKTEIVSTNKNSDFPSILRPMNPYEKEMMQISVEKIYEDFVNRVASGRKMSSVSVDSIGQGRVWSGTNALKIGLVDEMGGLKDAIQGAAKLAGIESFTIRELPVLEDPYMRIISQLGGEVRMSILKSELGESVKYYKMIQEVKDISRIQARLPYFLDVH